MDRLTGAADVGELVAVERYLDRRARAHPGHRYGIALVDVTGLRTVNDTFGPAVGDAVLVELAARLTDLAPQGCVARVGGDKFAVLVDDRGSDELSQFARVIRRVVNREPFAVDGMDVPVHVRVTFRTGPSTHRATELLWAVLREHHVEGSLALHERLRALERLADLDGLLASQDDLRTRLAVAEQRARHDAVTGLLNRHGYEDVLSTMAPPSAMAFVDVDDLRVLNKAEGGNWRAGDDALRGVARVLGDLRPDVVAIRWGGDEFLVLLPDLGASEARSLLEQAFAAPSRWLRAGGRQVTCSGGAAAVTVAGDHDRAMALAQERTQEAKSGGKARFLA